MTRPLRMIDFVLDTTNVYFRFQFAWFSVKFHGRWIACTFSLFAVKQNRRISTFHSTGGALSFFVYCEFTVLIYWIRVRVMVHLHLPGFVRLRNYSKTSAQGHCYTPFIRYNRLSNRLYNRFDNRLYRVNKHSTGCQTGLTTGWMFVYTIQPIVKPVWQPVWQQLVSCKRCFINF